MAEPIEVNADLRHEHFPHKVYTRAKWADEWTESPYLYCDWYEEAAAPEVGRAAFSWRYGRGLQPAETGWATYTPKALSWHFVRVELEQGEDDPLYWYGVFIDDARMLYGDIVKDGSRIENGVQFLAAVGVEGLLSKIIVNKSYVGETSDFTTVGRGIAFNSNDGHLFRGNQGDISDEFRFFFKATTEDAKRWSNDSIVRYLVNTYLWQHTAGIEGSLEWRLDAGNGLTAAASIMEAVPAHGQSIKALLDGLLDRRRLLGYVVEVRPSATDPNGPEIAFIRDFTFNQQSFSLPAEGDLEQADYPATVAEDLDFGTAKDVLDAQVRYDCTTAYSRVIVQGGRLVSCFTIQSPELVKGWTDEQEEAYEKAASEADDYPTDEVEQAQRNDCCRKTDRIKPAFARFVVASDWTAMQGDFAVFPEMNAGDVSIGDSAGFYRPGLRFMRQLPLKVGVDYKDDLITTETATQYDKDELLVDYVAPACFIPIDDERYIHAETASISDTPTGEPLLDWSCDVRVIHEDAGFELVVHGAPQHVIASDEFSSTIADDVEPEKSWKSFLFTVAAESDQHLEVVWPPYSDEVVESDPTVIADRSPEAASVVGTDVDAELIIQMDDAEAWYVVPDTVVGLEDGKIKRTNLGGFIRDDRPRMLRVAKVAYSYYSTPKRAFTISYRQLTGVFYIGQMIGKITTGDKEIDVNSVVTMIRRDLLQGVTTVMTDHAEIDARAFG